MHGVIQWLRIYVVAHILHVTRSKLSTDEPLWSLVVKVFIAVEKRSCSTDSVVSVQLGRKMELGNRVLDLLGSMLC